MSEQPQFEPISDEARRRKAELEASLRQDVAQPSGKPPTGEPSTPRPSTGRRVTENLRGTLNDVQYFNYLQAKQKNYLANLKRLNAEDAQKYALTDDEAQEYDRLRRTVLGRAQITAGQIGEVEAQARRRAGRSLDYLAERNKEAQARAVRDAIRDDADRRLREAAERAAEVSATQVTTSAPSAEESLFALKTETPIDFSEANNLEYDIMSGTYKPKAPEHLPSENAEYDIFTGEYKPRRGAKRSEAPTHDEGLDRNFNVFTGEHEPAPPELPDLEELHDEGIDSSFNIVTGRHEPPSGPAGDTSDRDKYFNPLTGEYEVPKIASQVSPQTPLPSTPANETTEVSQVADTLKFYGVGAPTQTFTPAPLTSASTAQAPVNVAKPTVSSGQLYDTASALSPEEIQRVAPQGVVNFYRIIGRNKVLKGSLPLNQTQLQVTEYGSKSKLKAPKPFIPYSARNAIVNAEAHS